MTSYTARITTDPTLGTPGPVVIVAADQTLEPTEPTFWADLVDHYDDVDVIDEAGQSLFTAGWELTSDWTAVNEGWRADVAKIPEAEGTRACRGARSRTARSGAKDLWQIVDHYLP